MRTLLVRDYVLSFLAFFSCMAAGHALTPTIPIYLARLATIEREIGILVGALGVAALLSRFVAGGLLRRYPEKLVMLWSATLFILVYLAFILFKPFWPFFLARLFQGIAFACFDTAAISYVIRIVPLENRPRAISYLLVASPLSSAFVASASVFVLNEYSFTILLLGCTGLSVCALLFSLKLKSGKTVKQMEASAARSGLFFEPRILAPAILSFLFSFSWGGLGAFFPLYAIQCGVTNPGHFFSAMAIVLIVARLTGGRILDTYSKEKIMPIVILTSMTALLILAFSKTLPLFIFVGMLWGIGGGFLPPISLAYALDYAGSSDGTSVGTYQAFMDLGFGLGPAIMGMIIPVTGYQVMFLCLAFICFVNVCYFQFYLRKKTRNTILNSYG
jgi:predicted MFS family arabinose efflux permease